MKRILSWIIGCALLFSTSAWVPASAADAWPSRPIRLIAPVPPGGGVDILARAIGQKLQGSLGVPVVVENKPGASAVIGTDLVAKSTPDGYTLLMGYSVLGTNKYLVQNLPYDLDRDLVPISYVGYIPLVLVTPPSLGAGAHLAAELFKHMTGVSVLHVPYKGNAPALADVLGGHVSLMFDTITTSLPMIRSGKLKALATTGPTRSALAPELPTMIEAGVPGFEISAWYAVLAPAKTPRDVLERLNGAIDRAIADPDLARQMAEQGVVLTGGTLAQAKAFLDGEVARWGPIIKAADIKAE